MADFAVINAEGDTMRTEVIYEFKGIINGIEFNDKTLYFSVEYILQELEYTYNVKVPYTLVQDMKCSLNYLYSRPKCGAIGEIEYDLIKCIRTTNTIQKLYFYTNYALPNHFDAINKKFADWDNTYGKDQIIYDVTNSK